MLEKTPEQILILGSEAVDVDSFVSSYLAVELLRLAGEKFLPFRQLSFSRIPFTVFLPIESRELCWRLEIDYLLRYLVGAKTFALTTDLANLLFSGVQAAVAYIPGGLDCRLPESTLVLVDRHRLSGKERAWEGAVSLIFDHRPDSGACAGAVQRWIVPRVSCAVLLLEQAIRYNVLDRFSRAGKLMALSAIHLDSRQHPLRDSPESQAVWSALRENLSVHYSEPELSDFLLGLESVSESIPEKLGLYEQICLDMKVLEENSIRIAVGVVGIGAEDLRNRFTPGEDQGQNPVLLITERILSEKKADLLFVLHRFSKRNRKRCLTLLLRAGPSKKTAELQSVLMDCLEGAETFPLDVLQSGSNLRQWVQRDQRQTRKQFIPFLAELCRSHVPL